MWLPQGGALKIENLQFTQYSIIMLLSSMLIYLIPRVDKELLWHQCIYSASPNIITFNIGCWYGRTSFGPLAMR